MARYTITLTMQEGDGKPEVVKHRVDVADRQEADAAALHEAYEARSDGWTVTHVRVTGPR